MRSSSPDHHHHHSASRHRDPPPPRSSSHWGHGWSGSSDHHYSYDYDYGSATSSHHYSRRGRHSARLGKPEMLMEDARKLKHTGDRTVSYFISRTTPKLSVHILTIQNSEVEKAQYYLDAALTYMMYCVSKEVRFGKMYVCALIVLCVLIRRRVIQIKRSCRPQSCC